MEPPAPGPDHLYPHPEVADPPPLRSTLKLISEHLKLISEPPTLDSATGVADPQSQGRQGSSLKLILDHLKLIPDDLKLISEVPGVILQLAA